MSDIVVNMGDLFIVANSLNNSWLTKSPTSLYCCHCLTEQGRGSDTHTETCPVRVAQKLLDKLNSRDGEIDRSGKTTEQMLSAPQSSFYVWYQQNRHYPFRLAQHLGRSDLQIISAADAELGDVFRGNDYKVVFDHYQRRDLYNVMRELHQQGRLIE